MSLSNAVIVELFEAQDATRSGCFLVTSIWEFRTFHSWGLSLTVNFATLSCRDSQHSIWVQKFGLIIGVGKPWKFYFTNSLLPGRVARAFSPSTWESDFFVASLVYRVNSITDKAAQRNLGLKKTKQDKKVILNSRGNVCK